MKSNCLQTLNPKLAKEWHPTKNGILTPRDVTAGSHKKVWWICKKGHVWKTTVKNRNRGAGCTFCSGQTSMIELRIFAEMKFLFKNVKHRIKMYGNECDMFIPDYKIAIEYDGSYWHRNKHNLDKEKTKSLSDNGIFVIRIREKGLRKISKLDIIYSNKGNHFDLIKNLLNKILDKINLDKEHERKIKLYLKNKSIANEKEFTKLLEILPSPLPEKSLHETNKLLSKEWHLSYNGNLTPKDVTPHSHLKIWWLCKKGHEWQASVINRNKGSGCPYCSGRLASIESNLTRLNPKLAKEWHPTKNGILTPRDVTAGSHKKVWWICKKGHEWVASIGSRNSGNKCPYCSGRKVNEDNCLQTVNPHLAEEWHPTMNGKLTPYDITPGSGVKVWWKCKKGHVWQATVNKRDYGRGCPYCYREGRKTH